MNYPEVLIEIRPSKLGGVGIFAVRDFKQGEVIIPADGYEFQKPIPWSKLEEFDDSFKRLVGIHCSGTPEGFWPPEDLDFNNLMIEWYFNHSCEGNVGFDEPGNYLAIRDIKKDEELYFDYGLVEANPNFRMECHCNSKNCRKVITGNDWKNGVVDERYMLGPLKAKLKKINL